MLDVSVEPSIDRSLRQDLVYERAPRDCLSCHARRAQGTGALPVPAVGRRTPRPRHPQRHQEADLLVSGADGAGLVPQGRGQDPTGSRVRRVAGHRLPLRGRRHRGPDRSSARPARGTEAGRRRRLVARDPRRQAVRHRPPRGDHHQRQGRADRRLVLRQAPRLRREHPGAHAPGRTPDLDLRRRPRPPARLHLRPAPRHHRRPVLGRIPTEPAHPGRRRLRRRGPRYPHAGQATRGRPPARHRQPRLQPASAIPTRPRRTGLRPAHRPLVWRSVRQRPVRMANPRSPRQRIDRRIRLRARLSTARRRPSLGCL